MLHKIFIGSFFIFALSCSKSDLPLFNKLDTLRILAFQVSLPEVDPGTTVTVTPIISDLKGNSLTYTAQTCLDFGISYGADPTCENNPTKQVFANQIALTLPGPVENWTGAANSFSVTAPPAGLIFAARSSQDKMNGINFIIEYILTDDLGQSVRSIKRLVVSDPTKTNKNTNPPMTEIFSNGIAMNSLTLGTKVNLSTDLTLTSAESYSIINLDGTVTAFTEKLAVTWFITDGETKNFRTEDTKSNEYTTPTEGPSGRSVYLIAIARDDRGGLSFVKKKF